MNEHPVPLLNPYLDLYLELCTQPAELQLALRKKLIWAFSWAIPSQNAILEIARLGDSVVEIGAGTGYWAWLLGQAGCKVAAFDAEPRQRPHWTPIQSSSTSVFENYGSSTLLLCWPPWNDPMAEHALARHRGQYLVYVGESEGGRTANAEFFRQLQESMILEKEIQIPTWPGFFDRVMIFRRRPNPG
jgi:hypothetical protein